MYKDFIFSYILIRCWYNNDWVIKLLNRLRYILGKKVRDILVCYAISMNQSKVLM